MPGPSNRSRYQRSRQVPVRANDSVRRAYDLLRSSLSTLEPDTLLVEGDLVDDLSASRKTVREVLQLLAAEGLVSRGPKVGTTVRDSTVLALDEIMPITDWGVRRAMHGRVLESFVIPAPAIVGDRLGLAEHAPLAVLETLIIEDTTPIALSVSYVGWHRGPEGYPGAKEPDIIAFLEEQLEVCVGGSHTTLAAVACDAQTAALLEVREGEPILFLEDLLFDVDGAARAISQIRYRSDRVTLSAQARRRGTEGRDVG